MNIQELSDTTDPKESYSYKIIVIGDSGVGKSNFINRFLGNDFKSHSISTIGVELFTKYYEVNYTVGNTNQIDVVKVNIWDTAGQEKYKSVTSSYYKGSKGIFVLYDTTKLETFMNTTDWLKDIEEFCNNNPSIMLVGTKSDLESLKVIDSDILEQKAQNNSK